VAELFHNHGRCQGPDAGPQTVGQHHAGTGRHQLLFFEPVVGFSDAQWIERARQAADHKAEAKQHSIARGPENGDQRRRQGRGGGHHEDDFFAVKTVRQGADGILHDQHTAYGDGEKHGNARHVEADGIAVDRAETEHRAFHQTDDQHAEYAERREQKQAPDAEPRLLPDLGVAGAAQRHRQQRRDEQDAGDHQQAATRRVAKIEQQRTDGESGIHNDDVDRQYPPSRRVGRAVVEPALGDHGEAGHAIAGNQAQGHPGNHGVAGEHQQQDGNGVTGGVDREGANVADPVDHPGAEHRAAKQADKISRGNGTDDQTGGAFRRQANADDGHQRARTDVENDNAKQQGAGRLYDRPETDVVTAISACGAGTIHHTTPNVPEKRSRSGFRRIPSSTSGWGDV